LSKTKHSKLVVGDKAPLFSLPNKEGKQVHLKKFLKKKLIVLFFYPKDESPGCTAEVCQFRDRFELFQKAGAEVIGISGDSLTSHKQFAEKYSLPFQLLSDEDNAVRKLYGVRSTLGLIPGRATFIIDKKGVIRHIFVSQFNPKKHVSEALKIITKIKEEK